MRKEKQIIPDNLIFFKLSCDECMETVMIPNKEYGDQYSAESNSFI